MKFILKYVKPFKWWMTLGFTIKVLGAVAELALPYILSYILDDLVPLGHVPSILLWGGAMLLFAAAALVFNIVANRMAARVARDSARLIRHDLFRRTLYLSPAQVDRITVPSLEARLTTDTYNVHHFIGMIQRLGVRAPILLVGGLCITWILDRNLTLVMLCVLPLICLVVFGISKRGIPLYAESQKAVDRMVCTVREDAQGVRVIRALSRTDDEQARFENANRALVAREKRAGLIMGLSNPLINLLLNLGLSGVVIVGAYLVIREVSTPGRIIGFIQYFTLISNAMLAVTRLFVQYAKGTASAGRIREVVELPQDLCQLPCPDAEPVSSCNISFENVTFTYATDKGQAQEPALSDISFSLPEGASLGIIGATGSGKSTLVKLLLRFYDPDSGTVSIGGRDVRTLPPDEFKAMFGVCQQSDFIYNGTVFENIDFGRDLSREQVMTAVRTAQAEEFIAATPEGLDRELSAGGTNVSGGQRQRLLLARALAGKPKILVLDDSSSALDYRTDAALRAALDTDCRGTTRVIVAQRVSSVRSCDLILVLDNGRVIGRGTHDELMENCPVYAEIATSQMGGAILD